jgi:hypothetical protein
MTVIHLTGRITEDHRLEVELPDDLPVGAVDVTLHIQEASMTFAGKTGAEIVQKLIETDGWWDSPEITDGGEWVEELRRKEIEKRNIQW